MSSKVSKAGYLTITGGSALVFVVLGMALDKVQVKRKFFE